MRPLAFANAQPITGERKLSPWLLRWYGMLAQGSHQGVQLSASRSGEAKNLGAPPTGACTHAAYPAPRRPTCAVEAQMDGRKSASDIDHRKKGW